MDGGAWWAAVYGVAQSWTYSTGTLRPESDMERTPEVPVENQRKQYQNEKGVGEIESGMFKLIGVQFSST